MLGRMQEWPLLMHKIIDFAAIQFRPARKSSRGRSKGRCIERIIARFGSVALKVAKRLERDGIRLGDRVATLAWNGFRHLESWYGIAGVGAVYHTVNPRLFPDQIAWIISTNAEDRIVLTDLHLRAAAGGDGGSFGDGRALCRPYGPRPHAGDEAQERRRLRGLDRRSRQRASPGRSLTSAHAAGLCYTSGGTTGNPKGVLYSHRSNILHSMMASTSRLPDVDGLRFGAADRADVPRQFLGPGALLPDARLAHGDAGRAARQPRSMTFSRPRKVTMSTRRCPLSGSACCNICGRRTRKALDSQVRLGSAAPPVRPSDPRFRGRLRRRRAPRLGNDPK